MLTFSQVRTSCTGLFWGCHFPGWTSPFSHLLLIGQVLQLRLFWPPTGLSPVGLCLSIPEGSKTEQSTQMGSHECWTERDTPSLQCLGFFAVSASWGAVGHFQSWGTWLAYNELVSARAHRSFPAEMLLTRPQPVSLHWCFLPRDSPWYLSLLHCMRLFTHSCGLTRSLWMIALISCILTHPAKVLSSTKLVKISSISSSR